MLLLVTVTASFINIYGFCWLVFDLYATAPVPAFFRGEVSAVVNQVTMKMKIKQMIQNSPPPELLGKI